MKYWIVSIYVKSDGTWIHKAYSDRLEAITVALCLATSFKVKLKRCKLNVVGFMSLYSIDGRRL